MGKSIGKNRLLKKKVRFYTLMQFSRIFCIANAFTENRKSRVEGCFPLAAASITFLLFKGMVRSE